MNEQELNKRLNIIEPCNVTITMKPVNLIPFFALLETESVEVEHRFKTCEL
jgi:hypothetical protein